jgi:hypothetical protein
MKPENKWKIQEIEVWQLKTYTYIYVSNIIL